MVYSTSFMFQGETFGADLHMLPFMAFCSPPTQWWEFVAGQALSSELICVNRLHY